MLMTDILDILYPLQDIQILNEEQKKDLEKIKSDLENTKVEVVESQNLASFI